VVSGKVVVEGEPLAEGATVTVLAPDDDQRLSKAGSSRLRPSSEKLAAAKSPAHRVVFTQRALAETREAVTWWRENRPAAPDAIREELARVVTLLAAQPRIGARARSERLPGVRRLFVSRVRCFIYYRVDERAASVVILAFWHESRGRGPGV
jgi:plasmid stabilization system protein ParE